MALAPRIDAPPDLVDDSDDDERPVVLAGAAMWPVSRTASHITVGEIMPDLIESSDDEMPALVADDPSLRGTCRSPAWGCAKPGRQG